MLRSFSPTALLVLLGGCATVSGGSFTSVSVEQLVAAPGAWEGRRIETTGLAIREFENLGLYSNYSEYCPQRTWSKAIYVQWDKVSSFRQSDNRREVVIRGTFRNLNGTEKRDKYGRVHVFLSTGAPGPGPLQDAVITRRISLARPKCSR